MPDSPESTRDPKALSRRDVIGRGLAGAAFLSMPRLLWAAGEPPATGTNVLARPWLDAAVGAERWISGTAIRGAPGTRWPADPSDMSSVQSNLYHGGAGIVLFYLELWSATGEARFLREAGEGADYLIATLPEAADLGEAGAGLYTGIAGVAWTLALVHRATREARHGEGARRAFSVLRGAARRGGEAFSWNASSDIISGSAGILLTLLWAERNLADGSARELAVGAGRHLAALGKPEKGGLKWAISDDVPRRYPNFSHGTAGAAYALATLHAATGEREFLDAALAGERYLGAIATPTARGGVRIFHSEPGGEELFYLSWCHGPAGTARLYHRLGEVTGVSRWREHIPRLAQAIVDSGVPEVRPDRSGYWNNVSQCCGNCGVTEFFVDLHRLTGERRHLEMAVRVARDTVSRATAEGNGLKWVQAEHRVRPELLIAHTGLMQGAAGVGLAMLHLDGAESGRAPFVVLPDSPFG